MPGVHLPAFSAAANGLFAEHGLDIAFVDGGDTVRRVAAGEAAFGLTAVVYFLQAQAAAQWQLPVRFAAVLHQRNPIAGIVAADAPITRPADLAGRATAAWALAFMLPEYRAGLARLGLDPPPVVELGSDVNPSDALQRGDVDVVPTWAETVTVRRKPGVEVRAVPLGIDTYASGVVAADGVPDDVVERLRLALAAAAQTQREDPGPGLDAFCARFPEIPRQDVVDNWDTFQAWAFADGRAPTSMEAARWHDTIAHTAAAHDLPTPPTPDRVYRHARPATPSTLHG